jgi:hypothetical protein
MIPSRGGNSIGDLGDLTTIELNAIGKLQNWEIVGCAYSHKPTGKGERNGREHVDIVSSSVHNVSAKRLALCENDTGA